MGKSDHESLEVAARLRGAWRGCGVDIAHPFSVRAWNEVAEPAQRLEDCARANPMAFFLANSRALWRHFVAALETTPSLLPCADPLDRYIEQAVTAPLAELTQRSVVHFSHDVERVRPFGRFAHHCGLAALGPCQLSIHTSLGPWIALRAVVIVDLDAIEAPTARNNPCGGCAQPCMEKFSAAQGKGVDAWRSWLEVRKACPVGIDMAYGPEQTRYHYTKDRGALRSAISSQP